MIFNFNVKKKNSTNTKWKENLKNGLSQLKYMEESSNNNTEEPKNDYFKINNDKNEKELKIVKIKLINQ